MTPSPYFDSTPAPRSRDLWSAETVIGSLVVLGIPDDDARATITRYVSAHPDGPPMPLNRIMLTLAEVNYLRGQFSLPEIKDYSSDDAGEQLITEARYASRHDPDVVHLTEQYLQALRHEIEAGRAYGDATRAASRANRDHQNAILAVQNTHTELLEAIEATILGTDTHDDEQDTDQSPEQPE